MAKILVISPTPTHPQDAGNRARIFSMLSALKRAGHQIYFTFIRMEDGDTTAMAEAWDDFFFIPYRRPKGHWTKRTYDQWAQRLGRNSVLPYRIDDWYARSLTRQLKDIKEQVQPDVVIVEYVFFSKALGCFNADTLKILDTHDVFGGRHKLYRKRGIHPVFFYTTDREESKALDRADVVLAIQDEEAAHFSSLTQRKVITVGHLASVPYEGDSSVDSNRLLFVGSGNDINVDGVSWFIEAILPRLRMARPGIELDVVGKCANKINSSTGVNLVGPVADLAPHYQQAAVVINPLRFGTGLKIKTIEALAYGKPLVTTSVGAVGLEDAAGEAFLVADTEDEFIEKLLRLVRADAEAKAIGIRARQFAMDYNKKTLLPLLSMINGTTATKGWGYR